jgi:diguanylate cyclase (GGDEF)-like protein
MNGTHPIPYALLIALAVVLASAGLWSPLLHALVPADAVLPLPLHTAMESFAIVVAMLVFAISWHTHAADRPGNLVIIACGFLAVGLLDFAHMMSYKGMPDFVTPSSPHKAIVFWLHARYVATLTLLAVAVRAWTPFASPRTPLRLLTATLMLCTLLYASELMHPGFWPETFVEGRGLTSVKITLEYLLIALLIPAAWIFHRKRRNGSNARATHLLTAVLITILSELCFTLYTNVYSIYSLLGHLYKIVAYYFIYRAIFVSGVEEPYARLQAEIEERIRAEQAADYLTHHDILTGLPNRRMLLSVLEHRLTMAAPNNRRSAVITINLDNFKSVNDSLGHNAGDEVLRLTGRRILAAVRDMDTLARHGADEFCLLLSDLGSSDDCLPILHKLLQSLQDPCVIGGQEVALTASLGVALYPDNGKDAATLIRHADLAMHRVKKNGGNGYGFFEEGMNAAAVEFLALRNGLKKALMREEFELHYQPQVDIDDKRLTGCEVLVRWRHPEQGLVPPACFIPVAEESGLILPLSNWILESACRQMVAWRQEGIAPPRIAVNLSALQFHRDNLVERVASVLKSSGLPASCLELELTESILMQDQESVLDTVRRLKAMGVRIAVDDFGTGYSSLSYLKRFAVDVLKIDQSFIRGIVDNQDDLAIVNAIIQMGHSLGLDILAEGVETEATREMLERYACNEAQGYLFGKPMPAEEFAQFMRRRAAA